MKHTTKLALLQVTICNELQVRVSSNQITIASYADAMREGVTFPPITVVKMGSGKEVRYILADGFHRYYAAEKAGRNTIAVKIVRGDMAEALRIALESNCAHGLPLTNADKRRAVEMAVKQWPELADSAIAQRVGVSHTFVNNVRPQVATVATSFRIGADGKSYPAKAPSRQKKAVEGTAPDATVKRQLPGKAPADKGQLDKTGIPIPRQTIENWNEADAEGPGTIRQALKELRSVKHLIQKVHDENRLSCSEIFKSTQQDICSLAQVIADVERAVPYAVCWVCNGKHPSDCETCNGRGFLSEFFWKTCCPEEIRKLRTPQ